MRIYDPKFSIVIILTQLLLSVKEHLEHLNWLREMIEKDPHSLDLISYGTTYEYLFFFVTIIAIFEMFSKPSWFKNSLRFFLVAIILGTEFSNFIPIESFYFGVYNTAWFSAIVAIFLLLIRSLIYIFKKVLI